MMAVRPSPRAAFPARADSHQSTLGRTAPLNSPIRSSPSHRNQTDNLQSTVSDPNIYVVQPFKHASLPKEFTVPTKVRLHAIQSTVEVDLESD